MPYTDEQFQALEKATPESAKVLFDKMTPEEKTSLVREYQSYKQRKGVSPVATQVASPTKLTDMASLSPEEGLTRLYGAEKVKNIMQHPYIAKVVWTMATQPRIGRIGGPVMGSTPLENGASTGAIDIPVGLAQGAMTGVNSIMHLFGSNAGQYNKDLIDVVADLRDRRSKEGGESQLQRGLVSSLPVMAATAPMAPNGVIGTTVAGGIAGALQGAIEPLEGGGNKSRLANIRNKALWGAGSALAFGTVTKLGGKAVASIANKYRTDKAQKVMSELVSEGIEARPSTIMAASEETPREVIQSQASVQRFSDKLKKDMNETKFTGLDDLKEAVQAGGKRSAKAQEIIDLAHVGGGDWEQTVQTSAQIRHLQEKMRLDQLAAVRDGFADGLADVKYPSTIKRIDEGIARLKLDQTGDKASEIKYLQGLRDNLSGEVEGVGNRSFKAGSETRSSIGTDISNLYKGKNGVLGQPDVSVLQPIKDGLTSDLHIAAQRSGIPELANSDNLFRSEYAKYARLYKDPQIVEAMTTTNPSELANTIAKAGPERAQRMFDALDPKGQSAFTNGVWEESIKDALNKRTRDFIPGNVSGGIHDRMDSLGVAMTGENAERLKAIDNVMVHLAKAKPDLASALGQRIAEGSGGKVGWTVKTLSDLKGALVDKFFDTPKGREFLFSAARYEPGSDAFSKLMNQLPKVIPAFAPKPGPTLANPAQVQE